MENLIQITAAEYKQLLEASVRVKIFADYVNAEKYRIEREDCGRYLGFEVKKIEED